jgi:hypothetical protein
MVIRGTMGHFTHAKAGRRISASRFPHVRVFLSVPPGRLERPHTAPEAAALSTELRGHVALF